jgi:hypothetical protein
VDADWLVGWPASFPQEVLQAMQSKGPKLSEAASLIEAFEDAYRQMAAIGYRPAAPSDGIGGITVPLRELDLDAEATKYARRFLAEENDRQFWVGCSKGGTQRAFVWAVEAARLMCGFPTPRAARLLRMAADEYERVYRARHRRD